jgi:predicted dehydrogenase
LIPKTGQDVYRIMGSEGTLSVPDMKFWSYDSAERKSWTEKIHLSHIDVPTVKVPFELQVKHFVDVIRGSAEPICSGQDSLRAVAVCEAVRQAIRVGHAVDINV